MAAVTTSVIAGGSALLGYSEARNARKDARRAANQQAEGVRNAQQANIESTNRARDALSGLAPVSQQQLDLQNQLQTLQQGQTELGLTPFMQGGQVDPVTAAANAARSAIASRIEGQISELEAARQAPDPRQELLSGIQGQMDFTGSGFRNAQQTISPLAQMAMPNLMEQQNLLGLGGDQAYQDAISRVADPLRAEQERSFLRNNAALGGVGGNALSALAEQTRARTEANIGNRLGQLSSVNAPALNALQNLSNLRLNQGLSFADIMGGGGRDLAAQETARRQALANVELGQGSELAQLAQNLGTARAGGAAFAAQTQSPLSAGLTSGLNAFMGMGGMNMFGGAAQPTTAMNVTNPNLFGNIA